MVIRMLKWSQQINILDCLIGCCWICAMWDTVKASATCTLLTFWSCFFYIRGLTNWSLYTTDFEKALIYYGIRFQSSSVLKLRCFHNEAICYHVLPFMPALLAWMSIWWIHSYHTICIISFNNNFMIDGYVRCTCKFTSSKKQLKI
jgi:hypothetical protein